MQLCEDAALQVGSDPHTCVGWARAVKEGEALRLRGDGPLSFPSGPELLHAGIKNCRLADREGALKGEDAAVRGVVAPKAASFAYVSIASLPAIPIYTGIQRMWIFTMG
jgi:hypothetical protein